MAEGIAAILVGAPVTGTGGVTMAPLGTTPAPKDATTALPAAFERLGYVGDDGVTKTIDATDEKIKAWGGDTVKVVRQEHSVSYTFKFLESANAKTLKAIYGADNVIVTPPANNKAGTVEIRTTSKPLPHGMFTFEMKDAPATIREFVPDGQLSVAGAINFVHSNVIAYEVKLEAFPDANGVKSYTYIDDGTPAGP